MVQWTIRSIHDHSTRGNAPYYLVEDSWTPENTSARYPRLSAIHNGNNAYTSSWWLVNGNFLRLKNLQFGYTIPKKYLRKPILDYLTFVYM